MKRVPFEVPTEHYDQRIKEIDKQICSLIKKRKELSDGHPGFPTKQLIASWAEEYDFYEDFLNSLFLNFMSEEMYKPVVEPKGFVKNIPLLKVAEKGDTFYTVTFIQQYKNASVVHLHIDKSEPVKMAEEPHQHYSYFILSIEGDSTEYNCRYKGGSGSDGHITHQFVVSPALPDDCAKFKLVFKESEEPYRKPTGFQLRF